MIPRIYHPRWCSTDALPLVPVGMHVGCILWSTTGHVTGLATSSDSKPQVAFNALYAPAECNLKRVKLHQITDKIEKGLIVRPQKLS